MKDGEGLLTVAYRDWSTGDGFKGKKSKFRFNVRKKFFAVRVARHWKIFPREVGESPFLET